MKFMAAGGNRSFVAWIRGEESMARKGSSKLVFGLGMALRCSDGAVAEIEEARQRRQA